MAPLNIITMIIKSNIRHGKELRPQSEHRRVTSQDGTGWGMVGQGPYGRVWGQFLSNNERQM